MVELATVFVWTMKIILPIVLFYIYFKLQAPKEQTFAGPTGNVHIRNQLLAHRRAPAVRSSPKAESMSNIALKDQSQAPELFSLGPRAARPNGRSSGGGTREGGEKRRKPQEAKEKKEKLDAEAPPAEEIVNSAPPPKEDKMHLESLLNYVAFHSKEQQRTFCVDDAPPPPPPKTKPEATRPGKAPVVAVSGVAADKANLEAQMVLQGAIDFKRVDIAKDIYGRLVDSHVEITAKSFTFMIEGCVLANDLKSASDFLMKMETAGHTPEPELLDKVMDLYSKQKIQRESDLKAQEGKSRAQSDATKEDASPSARARLSPSAPVFVPTFAIPPPPPAKEEGEEGGTTASKVAAAPADEAAKSGEPSPDGEKPQGAEDGKAQPDAAEEPQRTKLVASAKIFEPQFGSMPLSWNADSMWNGENAWSAEGQWYGDFGWDGAKGKGKGKKGKSKGKGKWNGHDEYKGNGKGKGKGKGRHDDTEAWEESWDESYGEGEAEGKTESWGRAENKENKGTKGKGKGKVMKWVKKEE